MKAPFRVREGIATVQILHEVGGCSQKGDEGSGQELHKQWRQRVGGESHD